jgi:predicted aconitase with swiveling domain
MPIARKCHPGVGSSVRAVALVARDNFSTRYDLDRNAGVFCRPDHRLYGQNYVGKALVLITAKGGVASAWMLYDMVARGRAPAALVFQRSNTILAQGAAFADLALVDRFEEGDPTLWIRSGDDLLIEPANGLVTILNRD